MPVIGIDLGTINSQLCGRGLARRSAGHHPERGRVQLGRQGLPELRGGDRGWSVDGQMIIGELARRQAVVKRDNRRGRRGVGNARHRAHVGRLGERHDPSGNPARHRYAASSGVAQ